MEDKIFPILIKIQRIIKIKIVMKADIKKIINLKKKLGIKIRIKGIGNQNSQAIKEPITEDFILLTRITKVKEKLIRFLFQNHNKKHTKVY